MAGVRWALVGVSSLRAAGIDGGQVKGGRLCGKTVSPPPSLKEELAAKRGSDQRGGVSLWQSYRCQRRAFVLTVFWEPLTER